MAKGYQFTNRERLDRLASTKKTSMYSEVTPKRGYKHTHYQVIIGIRTGIEVDAMKLCNKEEEK
jgi:hypothetical protein